MTIELKSCPFCGGDAAIEHSYHEDEDRYPRDFWHVRVACQDCGAFTKDWQVYGNQQQKIANFHVREKAELDASILWNTRSDDSRIQALCDERARLLEMIGDAKIGFDRIYHHTFELGATNIICNEAIDWSNKLKGVTNE